MRKVKIKTTSKPKTRPMTIKEFIETDIVFDRSYQRAYGLDEILVESLLDAQITNIKNLRANHSGSGKTLGRIGLKLRDKKQSKSESEEDCVLLYSCPEGQHRKVSVSLYATALLAKDSDSDRIKEFKDMVFKNGVIHEDNFRFGVINGLKEGHVEVKEAKKDIVAYLLGYRDLEELDKKNTYIKTFLFYMGKIDEYIESHNDSEYSFFDFALSGFDHTYVDLTLLRKNDSEIEFYTNSFQHSKPQKEYDRVRNIAIESVCKNEKKEKELQVLILKFHEKLSETIRLNGNKTEKKMEELGELIYKSAVVELTQKERSDVCVLTKKANAFDSISNQLSFYLNRKDKKKVKAYEFYNECLRQLDIWSILISSGDIHSVILRNLTKNSIGDTYARIFPILIKAASLKKDILETHELNYLISSYLFHRITVRVGNTEKEADTFFNRLYWKVRGYNSLTEINNIIESSMKIGVDENGKNMIFSKEEFQENLLLNREIKPTFMRSFVLLKTLAALDSKEITTSRRKSNLAGIYKTVESYQVEHFTPKSFRTKVLPKLGMYDYEEKKRLSSMIEENLNKLSNLYFIEKETNGVLNNLPLEEKENILSNDGYIGIMNDYVNFSTGLSMDNSLESFEEFHINTTARLNEGILNYIPFKR